MEHFLHPIPTTRNVKKETILTKDAEKNSSLLCVMERIPTYETNVNDNKILLSTLQPPGKIHWSFPFLFQTLAVTSPVEAFQCRSSTHHCRYETTGSKKGCRRPERSWVIRSGAWEDEDRFSPCPYRIVPSWWVLPKGVRLPRRVLVRSKR